MQLLCQQDPRWAQIHLGDSPLTVGRYGCTTTCISMLSDYFGCFKDPGQMAVPANVIQLYNKDGLILWPTLKLDHMAFSWREYGCNHEKIKASLADPNGAVILQVNSSHWVVATSVVDDDTYSIADPWHGDRATTDRYKGNITGSAHFIRK